MIDFIKIIKDQAKRFPERIAVIDNGKKVSYRDFINLVNAISSHIIRYSPQPKIIFDLKQSAEAYALIVSVQNVGGIFCPLNPEAPLERKKQSFYKKSKFENRSFEI